MKNRFKNTIYIGALCVVILIMLFFNSISPYQLWDISLKIVDDDKLELLRFLWVNSAIVNLVLAISAKRYKKVFYILFIILTLLSLIKFVTLLFVGGIVAYPKNLFFIIIRWLLI